MPMNYVIKRSVSVRKCKPKKISDLLHFAFLSLPARITYLKLKTPCIMCIARTDKKPFYCLLLLYIFIEKLICQFEASYFKLYQ